MTPAIAKIGMQEEQQKQLGDRTLLKHGVVPKKSPACF
jgi:hypothetical protein